MSARALVIHPDDRSMLAYLRDSVERDTAEHAWLNAMLHRVDAAPPATPDAQRCLLCATGMQRLIESEYDGLATISGMSVCGQHFELVFQYGPLTLGEIGVHYGRWLADSPEIFEPKP